MTKQALNVIVLGISSDIGLALGRHWAEQGYNVVGTFRTKGDALAKSEKLFRGLYQCDLLNDASIDVCVSQIQADHGAWDVLVVCPGTMEPIGRFDACDFAEWSDGLAVNLIGPMRFLHECMGFRRQSGNGSSVLFFAGGGTNSARPNVSSYTVSKIALMKATELLDAEYDDVKFSIVGPGWVQTKIHRETLRAGSAAGPAYEETQKRIATDDFTSIEKILACCDWFIDTPKNAVGGRNFSVVNDGWGGDALEKALVADADMYKLRRAGNEKGRVAGTQDSEVMFNQVFSTLGELRVHHSRDSGVYGLLEGLIARCVSDIFGEGGAQEVQLDSFGWIRMPFYSMGAINSTHLFGLDELIIFAFYAANSNNYKRVADIGANIGLHSIMMAKAGFAVRCFEPDPVTFGRLTENLALNEVDDVVECHQKAVSSAKGVLEFTRVLGNMTGSHLSGSKEAPYGDLEKFEVEVDEIVEIMNAVDMIKIDVEGHEAELISSTRQEDWKSTDAIIEVGTHENALRIFKHLTDIQVNMFSQKTGWQKVGDITHMPNSYKEGSLFISAKAEMPWGAPS